MEKNCLRPTDGRLTGFHLAIIAPACLDRFQPICNQCDIASLSANRMRSIWLRPRRWSMIMMRMTKMMMMISKVRRGWVAVGVDVRIYRHDLPSADSPPHHHENYHDEGHHDENYQLLWMFILCICLLCLMSICRYTNLLAQAINLIVFQRECVKVGYTIKKDFKKRPNECLKSWANEIKRWGCQTSLKISSN